MAWVSCANSMLTTWLHALKDRVMEATPVSRASLQTRCGGMRLQSCPSTLSLDAVGLEFFFFHLRRGQRLKTLPTNFFFCFKPKSLGTGPKLVGLKNWSRS